jgi:hypothetical protein
MCGSNIANGLFCLVQMCDCMVAIGHDDQHGVEDYKGADVVNIYI